MSELSRDDPSASAEGSLRWHAALRTLLSPGIWLVLVVQVLLLFALRWRLPPDANPIFSAVAILLTAGALLAFFYLQAGVYQALTRGREVVLVLEIVEAGKPVFTRFVWLMIKAALLFAAVMNVLMLVALWVTGMEFKDLVQSLTRLFGPLTGALSFVFAYWLPYVFLQGEFRLFPSLQAALEIAWNRISTSAYLALLLIAPAVVTVLLPVPGLIWLEALASLISGFLGWVAYVYAVEILQRRRLSSAPNIPQDASTGG